MPDQRPETRPNFDITRRNITVVGAFNAAILRPHWALAQGLLKEGEEIGFALSVDGPTEFYCEGRDLGWVVRADRLVVFGAMEQAASFTAGVLTKLAHTPIRAIGINIRLEAGKTDTPQIKQGTIVVGDQLADVALGVLRGTLEGAELSLKVSRPDGVRVTVKTGWAVEGTEFAFNFHRDEQNCNAAADFALGAPGFEKEAQELKRRLAE